MLKRENHIEIDRRKFYKTVLALVVPMALQNLINVGVTAADVIMLGAVGEKALSGASLAGQIQYDIVPVRSDLRSDGAHGSVLGKRRPGCD